MMLADRLFLGDAIEGMQAQPAESAHLVIADPPYNIGYHYDVYDDRKSRDEYLDWSRGWIAAAARLLSEDGSLWIAICDEYAAEVKRIAEQCSLKLRNWVIWYYTFGVNCTTKFNRSHTHFLHLVKSERHHRFFPDEIRVPSARQLVYADRRAYSAGKVPDNTWILRPQDVPGGFDPLDDTWYFPRVAGTFKQRARFHSCQLPEQLLGRIIRACSQPRELVVDPFAGTGSTLVVAKKLGRKWAGWEISEAYYRHAMARLERTEPGDPLEGPEDPLASAPTTARGRSLRPKETIDEPGLLEAFKRAHDGHSADRVIADPVLNAGFVEQCRRIGLAGRPREWNWGLMNLRKRGALSDIPTEHRTIIPRSTMDRYLDASEIALRRMIDAGYPSLDCVVCDPWAAAQFDQIASSIAPGFTALEYRWGALCLRKEASEGRRLVDPAKRHLRNFAQVKPVLLDDFRCESRSIAGAVYRLGADKDVAVYVGQTAHLKPRIKRLRERVYQLDPMVVRSGPWLIWCAPIPQPALRRGLQSLLIGKEAPRLNYLELAAS